MSYPLARMAIIRMEEGNFSPTLNDMYTKYNEIYGTDYKAPNDTLKISKMLSKIRKIVYDSFNIPCISIGMDLKRAKSGNPANAIHFLQKEDESMFEEDFMSIYNRALTYYGITRRRVRLAKSLELISPAMINRLGLPNGNGFVP